MAPVTFSALTPEETAGLIHLARRIWHAHYPGIITVAQIDYMLDRGYTSLVIDEEVRRQGILWHTIRYDGTLIGFFSVGPHGGRVMKLHKLYVDPEYHGRGIGALALAEVERLARDHGAASLVLNVNKQNRLAIRAYERAGWHVSSEVIQDIGSGYVMDDYIMKKELS